MDEEVSEEKPEIAESARERAREVVRDLGARIARLRSEKGWTQPDLARRLEVSRERLSKWERGKHEPPLDMVMALCDALEVSIDELVTGSPAPEVAAYVETLQEAARIVARIEPLLRRAGFLRDDEQGEKS
jgi:transcriptional regulator with XRE-family HTH domain